MAAYPKRLIEVDLPIKRISAHARREKSIRHGHICTLHIWWARRPLAACRAVICATLWPDPADELCPQSFREDAYRILCKLRDDVHNASISGDQRAARCPVDRIDFPSDSADCAGIRRALLDFIAEFACWELSTNRYFLDAARALSAAAHSVLDDGSTARQLVADPFAGGGSIPLEAIRIGADAYASDVNPVAIVLNKVLLEHIPKYGGLLATEIRRRGQDIKAQAMRELSAYYPRDPDGSSPVAYLWARTIRCEGPGCGAVLPLIRSPWLARRPGRNIALRLVPRPRLKRVDFEIIEGTMSDGLHDGTVARGAATCPLCGYTTPVASVREQLKVRRGGTHDARLFCVVLTRRDCEGKFYRLANARDEEIAARATRRLQELQMATLESANLPNEKISVNEIRRIPVPLYGMCSWGDLFSPRQALALSTLARLTYQHTVEHGAGQDSALAQAIGTCLALAVSRQADYTSALCTWHPNRETLGHTFTRQALAMVWDFAEVVPFSGSTGDFGGALDWIARVCEANTVLTHPAQTECASATASPLPDDSVHALVTDPPYYDAVPYAHLADFFYVWLRRCIGHIYPDIFASPTVLKDEEIVVDRAHRLSTSVKDVAFYERELTRAFAEGRRIVMPGGTGTIVFASKTTASWEAVLRGVVDAGWVVTASWPIDTELPNRLAAHGQARLASSIHLVCRPREHPDGSLRTDDVGDWRDVLQELPPRIHEWLPRLAAEGIVGADAIFACLGPALEIFSRYSSVEKASGEEVDLSEYLIHVWAAVAKEALTMVFKGADATGFEEDARLTAMWLWTLSTGSQDGTGDEGQDGNATSAPSGFALEYDAARKIAQGLGAHLETLTSVVEAKGETARLLPVSERTRYLFGKDEGQAPKKRGRKKAKQMTFFGELEQAEQEGGGWGEKSAPPPGQTTLDRLHQSMILFAAGRNEAMKRFLVEEGIGNDQRFWRLAQALSALYPSSADEKRWVDGVLARKKGMGF